MNYSIHLKVKIHFTGQCGIDEDEIVVGQRDFREEIVFVDGECAIAVAERHHPFVAKDEFPFGPVGCDHGQPLAQESASRSAWNPIQRILKIEGKQIIFQQTVFLNLN